MGRLICRCTPTRPHVRYVIRIKDSVNGTVVATVENAKNIGYANYLNDVPQMFFTLDQEDEKAGEIVAQTGRAHLLARRLHA